jgi:hypothetical protein
MVERPPGVARPVGEPSFREPGAAFEVRRRRSGELAKGAENLFEARRARFQERGFFGEQRQVGLGQIEDVVYRSAETDADDRKPKRVQMRLEQVLVGEIDRRRRHCARNDSLRFDPVLALFGDSLEAKRKDCAPLAGKSTMNRLEQGPARDAPAITRSAAIPRHCRTCSSTCSSMRMARSTTARFASNLVAPERY